MRSQSSSGDLLRDLYQELILDHNQNPRNFRRLEMANHTAEGYNPLCGDQITVYVQISRGSCGKDDVIQDISFEGSGCAISKASASIMTTILKGKTREEARGIFNTFRHMITTGEIDTDGIGKLAVLSGVHKYPTRVKCASLAWHTVNNILEERTETATTEQQK